MSLDGIKTLLQLGINTTKVNFYHLTAEALIRLGSTSIIKPDLKGINFYVYVDGVHVKVYGTIDEIPTIIAITVDDALGTKKMAAEFSFETYDDDSDNKVGGIFNIRRFFKSEDTETEWTGFLKWTTHYFHVQDCYHYRCDSTNFLDNIAQYLITGLIGIKPSIYLDALNQENSGSSEQKPAGKFTNAFTSTGFKSYQQNGNEVIQLGLNLNELTGINALKEVEATITSQHIDYEGSSTGMDVIGSLHATMRINFATIFNINITLDAAVAEGNKEAAQAALLNATSIIDKACTKGVYHKNNASRKVSRLAKAVNGINQSGKYSMYEAIGFIIKKPVDYDRFFYCLFFFAMIFGFSFSLNFIVCFIFSFSFICLYLYLYLYLYRYLCLNLSQVILRIQMLWHMIVSPSRFLMVKTPSSYII